MESNKIVRELIFWGVWLIIPLIIEVFAGLIGVILAIVRFASRKNITLDFEPAVTIIVPVYNSEATLKACLDSVVNQDYCIDNIQLFLIDNGCKDNSYDIFIKYQQEHPELRTWWMNAYQGKSKALNKGIFSSNGKYIINIDSDGFLDKYAIKNMVLQFEQNPDISSMTGGVLIDWKLVAETKRGLLKQIRLCEYFEYMESFLVGRKYQSIFNSMYTMAGAFSAFRSEVLLKTQLYNFETLGEDTHMTFQIRKLIGGKIVICDEAFLYVDPIESFDKLYTQRQRWQRGGIEVASLFSEMHVGGIRGYISKFALRIMIMDHTSVFPRLIWFFALIYLYFLNYPLKLLIGANLLLYACYSFNSFIYLIASMLFLKSQKATRKYALKHWYICFMMPMYRFMLYWIRLAGIINSIKTGSKWKTETLSDEIKTIKKGVTDSVKRRTSFIDKLRGMINNE